mmetsp:Transcript_22661/g.57712  ORF Transcript_22661/g.57712 Transcript_22661/m.57712 type:complete len:224 (-) Transcript_22661:171-842(-)
MMATCDSYSGRRMEARRASRAWRWAPCSNGVIGSDDGTCALSSSFIQSYVGRMQSSLGCAGRVARNLASCSSTRAARHILTAMGRWSCATLTTWRGSAACPGIEAPRAGCKPSRLHVASGLSVTWPSSRTSPRRRPPATLTTRRCGRDTRRRRLNTGAQPALRACRLSARRRCTGTTPSRRPWRPAGVYFDSVCSCARFCVAHWPLPRQHHHTRSARRRSARD